MAREIIKQPNGKYAQWSTVVDDFVMLDASPEEIIQDLLKIEEDDIRRRVLDKISELENGKTGFFSHTWEEACERAFEIHSNDKNWVDARAAIQLNSARKVNV